MSSVSRQSLSNKPPPSVPLSLCPQSSSSSVPQPPPELHLQQDLEQAPHQHRHQLILT